MDKPVEQERQRRTSGCTVKEKDGRGRTANAIDATAHQGQHIAGGASLEGAHGAAPGAVGAWPIQHADF